MPAWLPDPLWPWLMAFGAFVYIGGCIARDGLAKWVSAWWVVGIVLMQADIEEPIRWLHSAALWTVLTVVVGVRVGATLPAALLFLIPVGYAGLALNAFGLVAFGTGGEILAFAITEVAGVAAVIAGARRVPRGLFRMDRVRRADRIRILDYRRQVVAEPPEKDREVGKEAGR